MQGFTRTDPVSVTFPGTDVGSGDGTEASPPRQSVTWDCQSLISSSSYCSDVESSDVEYGSHLLHQSEIEEIPSFRWLSPLRPLSMPIHRPRIIGLPWKVVPKKVVPKKVILKLDLHDDEAKQKAMKAVSTLKGIDSIAMDMKDRMTVIGVADPVHILSKLRKLGRTEIVSIGPAKEPKKEEAKKEEPKKEEEEGAKEEEARRQEGWRQREDP